MNESKSSRGKTLARIFATAMALAFLLGAFSPVFASDERPQTYNGAVVIDKDVAPFVFQGDLRRLPLAAEWQPGQGIKEIPRRRKPLTLGGELYIPPQQSPNPQVDPLHLRQENVSTIDANRVFTTPELSLAGQGFTGVNPPDTVGDVGTDYYIQSINGSGGALFRIHDKNTGAVVAGPTAMDSLGSGNCASGNGDPIILYDQLAGRWLMSEFSSAGNLMCVYISQTGDPINGGWFNYSFQGASFPDYPKYGVWPDAYYVGTNENTTGLYAFDRSAMLNGQSASFQRLSVASLAGFGFQMLIPSDADGATAPPAGSPNYFMRHRDDEIHNAGSANGSQDFLEIWSYSVDFANSANTSITGPFNIAVTEFDSTLCGTSSFSCIPQPSGSNPLDPLREVVMNRLQYRNFGTHETLVGNLVTDVNGANRAGVRWFELRKVGAGNWSLHQEGTYAPGSTLNRWMGAISMDGDGNIALGYNVGSSSTSPGLRYTGRLATDALGVMTQGDNVLVNGSGSNGSVRYGDYASMNVDPVDDCTFWFTGQYNTSSQWSTRIGRFSYDSCGTPTCTPTAVADAGADQTICLGESATIGTAGLAGHSYSWAPGGQTSAQISVSPSATTDFTVTATTTCGSATDTVRVTVDDGSGGGGFSDDFEGGTSSWAATGLWHAVANSSCAGANNGFNSPVTAFYYGQDASCNYDTGSQTSGTLTSPVISGVDGSSTLTFQYYRQVESFSGDFDRTRVDILAGGSTTNVFSLNSSDASAAGWVSSGAIDLSAFAGQDIQVRFTFDSGDAQVNNFDGWFIDDVVVTGGASGCTPTNTAPTANISAPANGSTFTVGSSVSFSGSATDAEDGSLTGSLSWSSNLDGGIGSGGSFATSSLSEGTHTITASVSDSGGLSASDTVSITINAAPNTAPVVTITTPSGNISVVEGTSVSFAGTATDAEDGPLTGSLSWSSNLDGVIGSGASFSTSSLSVGVHTITASVSDSGGASASDTVGVTVTADPGTGCTDCIDWNAVGTVSYSSQDVSSNVSVEDGGDTILLTDNTWRRTTQTFNITPNTVLEFEFQSTAQGEIHGIGFDEDDTLTNDLRIFQLYGTQNWTGAIQDFDNYSGTSFVSYQIPVGEFYTGTMFLVLTNDNDAGSGNTSRFRNVRVFEAQQGACSVDEDFSGGFAGWSNGAGATCSTGAFVANNPTQQTSTVVTQVGGDHTTGTGNALFTATNSSAGNADVDGGECILVSPTYSVTDTSELSIWYFHGQRDTGDDAAGDYFELEISVNGGAFSPIVSIGDVRTVAAWTNATANVAAGSSVQLRVRVSDGAGPGDIVEGGIDDLSICVP